MRRISFLLLLLWMVAPQTMSGQVRLTDASDRAALRAWFVLLADAQFYRATPDVIDCAALVRHALREALRPHTPEWRRQAALAQAPAYPDVRVKTPVVNGSLAIFRVTDRPSNVNADAAATATRSAAPGHAPAASAGYAEFADARTIIRFNARPLGRDISALRPGDLIYFHQPSQDAPDHLMIYVGASTFETEGRDWVVYHTGPLDAQPSATSATRSTAARSSASDAASAPGAAAASGSPSAPSPPAAGEVRKVRLRDLMRHPSPRWRPVPGNPQFVGVFRLEML
jgi:uncharacterized protein YfaT (DUF1175 family)